MVDLASGSVEPTSSLANKGLRGSSRALRVPIKQRGTGRVHDADQDLLRRLRREQVISTDQCSVYQPAERFQDACTFIQADRHSQGFNFRPSAM